jgi:hypothetical protein
MSNRSRLLNLLRVKMHSVGRQYEEAKQGYRDGRNHARAGLPRDADGRAKVVCRRYAEKRAVRLDEALHPHCFDADSQDCQGCVEDIRAGVIETWE